MCSGDLFVTRPCNQELLRVHLFFLSMCWIMFLCCLRMFEPFAVLVSALTSQCASATTEAALKFKRWPSLSVHFSMATRSHGSDDNCTSPKLVRNSSQVIVLELNPPRSFPDGQREKCVPFRSRVNLQQKSPRCCFATKLDSLLAFSSED